MSAFLQVMYTVLGLMSGTSLDGLDLAICHFEEPTPGTWSGHIVAARTLTYDASMDRRLRFAHLLSGRELIFLHSEYGLYLGEVARAFMEESGQYPDLVASHGHTVYHEPARGFTFQLGSGAHIAKACGRPVVCDFRSSDVAAGGQGAPLVPAGEQALFPEYGSFLNLGGMANITLRVSEGLKAWDVAPANYVLNRLAAACGKPFDESGRLAASGKYLASLALKLEEIPYYRKAPPKSLGAEDVEKQFLPLLTTEHRPEDMLHTYCRHLAGRVAAELKAYGRKAIKRILVTGGGAHNTFLMQCLVDALGSEGYQVEVPPPLLINFKEAFVFAFLGLLRWLGRPNSLALATGAKTDSSGGAVYLP
ncbi:MAG: anhydro-N-acetylmuramic acid kinase [Flavobacteriales bacterium]|nr:anhydro-N-acetylmuramic acid kinase [Flavobacteriales bacterium]MCX7768812.1 anhydro-N-acetylmuramic acid kinase [Flavobacteriales bacterium]MDW8410414.1 anhydro-N-acetylmuramic acid kinase [Flavobacteriales bacterium]